MAKTTLTKAMRDEAVERMVADLAQPAVERAREKAAELVKAALANNTPREILEIYAQRPEYFESVGSVLLVLGYSGALSYDERQERLIDVDVPATRALRYTTDWPEVLGAVKYACGKPACEHIARAEEAVIAFCRAIDNREHLIETARRTMAQFRSVEALAEQWPDAVKYISIPEKRNLPAVRCDDLVAAIRALESEVRHA